MKIGNKKIHRAWFVMGGCCIMFATFYCMMSSGFSLFVAAICEDLGFARAEFNLFYTGGGLASLFLSFFGIKLANRFGVRKVYFVFALMMAAALLAMTVFTEAWQFCIAGFFTGQGLYYPLFIVPVILNNWFKKSYSTALGIAAASSGVAGALCSPILTKIIVTQGWRSALIVMLIGMEVLAIPAIIFLLRNDPSEVGLTAYGSDEVSAAAVVSTEDAGGLTLAEARKNGVFFLLFLTTFIIQFQIVLNSQSAAMMTDNGFSSTVMSTVMSVQMISLIVGKISVGIIRDKTRSAFITTAICQACGCAGTLLYLLSFKNKQVIVLYIAALLTGYSWASISLLPAAIVQAACGKKHFSSIYGPVLMGSSIMALMSSVIVGLLYDKTGSHDAALIVIAISWAIIIPITWVAIKMGRRGWAQSEQ